MSTIGYGAISPATPYGDLIVTIEAAVGLLGVAFATGLMLAKASQPRSGVLFSDRCVVTTRNGQRTLSFRVGNARGNEVVEATMSVSALVDELSPEGHHLRRIHAMKLVRRRTPIFTLSWTVMHVIDEDSPLWEVDWTKAEEHILSIIVTMTGHDATYGSTTHARHIYDPNDVRPDERFVDVISELEDGRLMVDYTHFHKTVPDAPASGDQPG
jgi:inward rectifier potassium channel